MIGPIVILLAAPSSRSFLLKRESYKASYQLLAQFAAEREIDLRFVLGKKHYHDGLFDSYWKFDGTQFVPFREQFAAKLVLLQTRYEGLAFEKRVNSALLEYLCRDKLKTAQLFSSYSKKTLPVTRTTNINDLSTDNVIVKPRYGTDGEQVLLMNKNAFRAEKFLDKKFIVQECIESSQGIKGITAKRHELRTYIFNGRLTAAYLRLPAEGSILSNISQGATAQQINIKDLPESVIPLINNVDKVFANITPRLYTIDIMFEDNKPWIVELNDQPGMPDISVQPLTNTFLLAMLEMFKEAVAPLKAQVNLQHVSI